MSMRPCLSVFFIITACFGSNMTVLAQPSSFVDLGSHLNPEQFSTPIHLESGNDIQWLRIELPAVFADEGFVDAWSLKACTSEFPCQDFLGNADMAVYNDAGDIIGRSRTGFDDFGGITESFGLTDPRPPVCIANEPGQYPAYWCGHVFDGFDGPLPVSGVIWLAVGTDLRVGLHNWAVQSGTSPGSLGRRDTLFFRIQPAGVPYCDPDLNWDGNADDGDIDYLINVLAGGDNPTGRNPDFNRDGSVDQGDIDALLNYVSGGPCP